MMAGDGQILVRRCDSRWQLLLLVAAVLTCGFASAETMYKSPGEFAVTHAFTGNSVEISARSERVLLDLAALGGTAVPSIEYRYVYVPGDPDAGPSSDFEYRAPVSVGLQVKMTQTYPDSVTHRTRDSTYAVDLAMPVVFRGADGSRVTPRSGSMLSAYP